MYNRCVCIKEISTFDGNRYEEGKLYNYSILFDIYIVAVNSSEYGFVPDNYQSKLKCGYEYDDCIFSDYFRFIDHYRDSIIDKVIQST